MGITGYKYRQNIFNLIYFFIDNCIDAYKLWTYSPPFPYSNPFWVPSNFTSSFSFLWTSMSSQCDPYMCECGALCWNTGHTPKENWISLPSSYDLPIALQLGMGAHVHLQSLPECRLTCIFHPWWSVGSSADKDHYRKPNQSKQELCSPIPT